MLQGLYRALTDCAAWPLNAHLRRRARRGKEDPARLTERHGLTAIPRPEGAVVWCHASSIGETTSMLPLINQLQNRDGYTVVLTTGTLNATLALADRLPSGTIHQYAPLDRHHWVQTFLDHWRPEFALRAESELWPNTLTALRERSIPCIMVNARLSAGAFARWRRVRGWASEILSGASLILAQGDENAERFRILGATLVETMRNLKIASPPLPVDDNARTALAAGIGGRPVWTIASSHPSDDSAILKIQAAAQQIRPDALAIVAPRHAERGAALATTFSEHGFQVARRSLNEPVTAETDLYIADTLGEMGLIYALSNVVLIGKSLSVEGGQNPLEPAHFGCAIVFGPHMEFFADVAEEMTTRGAALQVAGAEAAAKTVSELFRNDAERIALSDSARNYVSAPQDIVSNLMDSIDMHVEKYRERTAAPH